MNAGSLHIELLQKWYYRVSSVFLQQVKESEEWPGEKMGNSDWDVWNFCI